MNALEAARALLVNPPVPAAQTDGPVFCGTCRDEVAYGPHAADCPVLMLPQIVRALEAAQRIAEHGSEPHDCEYDWERGHGPVMAFCGASTLGPHLPDCPWLKLKAALSDPASS